MPNSATFATPAIVESGIAKPNAQGQAIMSTVVKIESANEKSFPSASQTMLAISAIDTTTGTKTAAILSTNFAKGGLLLCAWRTA